jgi:hypothetical protein
MASFAKEVGNH